MSWLPKKAVVVPVDFSDQSFAALKTARELVDDASALHVIHVLPVLEPAEPGVIWTTVDDESRRHHAAEALKERIGDGDLAGVEIKVAFGNPGREIAEYAERINADLIVMPSHGRTGLKKILLGSVTQRAVQLAHCPVLVLRH